MSSHCGGSIAPPQPAPAPCTDAGTRGLAIIKAGANLGNVDAFSASPFAALWSATKPVIGAINGACVTGGFELALACDILIASERAFFGDTHVRVGVIPVAVR